MILLWKRIPFKAVDPDYYPSIAVGVKKQNTPEILINIKEKIIEEKAKYFDVIVPDNVRIMVGEEIKKLKDNQLTKDVVGPRTIFGFIFSQIN